MVIFARKVSSLIAQLTNNDLDENYATLKTFFEK